MSASQISSVARLIGSAFSTGVDGVVDIAEFVHDRNGLRIASIVSRTALLAFNILNTIDKFSSFSPKTSAAIKGTELFVRTLDLPIQLIKTIAVKIAQNQKISVDDVIEIIARGVLGPLTGIARNSLEITCSEEKRWLSIGIKDPTAQRPIYECTGDPESYECKVIGFKDIDLEECQKTIQKFETAMCVLEGIETVSEVHYGIKRIVEACVEKKFSSRIPVDQNFERFIREYEQIILPVQPPRPQIIREAPVRPAMQQVQNDMIDIADIFDFKKLKSIPAEFGNDEVLKQYICPITQAPIRFPVVERTPEAIIIYEKEAIELWLRDHQVSPVTRLPLTIDTLISRPDIKAIIDRRLDFLAVNVKEHLAQLILQNNR